MATLVIIVLVWIAFSTAVVIFAAMASAQFSHEEDGLSEPRSRRNPQDVAAPANMGQAPVHQ
ncbi:MAG: hypothetical protein IPL78_25135 [Chloroflexi bacterium]|nr:hypothetical protein [Chloroflexota bacterium]